MKARSRLWLLALVCLCVLGACLGRGRAPLTPSRALGVEGARKPGAAAGAFRVLFAAPSGDAPLGSEISLLFDRPLRALGRADVPVPDITVSPRPPGAFQWIGDRALAFVPDAGVLPNATEFRVEVPASLRALDGSVLGAPYVLTFSTPRPKLVSASPANGENGVLANAKLELNLSQRASAQAIERAGALSVAGKRAAFSVSQGKPADAQHFVVTPREPLPLDREVRFVLGGEFVGEEGPLTAGEEQRVVFHTLSPLRVEGVDCDRETLHKLCAPGQGVALRFNNPVRWGALKRALQLPANVPASVPTGVTDDDEMTYFELPLRIVAGQRFSVRVRAGLSDVHGQRLARDFVADVAIDDLFPRVALGVEDGALVPAEQMAIPLGAVNAPGAGVVYAALTQQDVFAHEEEAEFIGRLLREPKARRLSFANGARNQLVRAALDPATLFPAHGRGVLGLVADYAPDERDSASFGRARVAKLGDLALTAKISRFGTNIWLTRLSSAAPVADAQIELWQKDGKRAQTRTNSDGAATFGAAEFAPSLSYDSTDRNAVLFASLGSEWTFERLSDVIEPWRMSVNADLSFAEQAQGLVFTERGVYRPGERVAVKGVVRRATARGSAVPKGEAVTLELVGPDDASEQRKNLTVSRFGTFSAEFVLPETARLGLHRLRATLGKQSFEHAVDVEQYRPAAFEAAVTGPRSAIRGDSATFELSGHYLFGAAMAGAHASLSLIRSPTSFQLPGNESAITDAGAYYADLEQTGLDFGNFARSEGDLDANGRWQSSAALALVQQRGPELVRASAELIDLTRQTGAAETATLVHPGEFYLALQAPESSFVAVGTRLSPRLTAVTPDGKPVPNVRVGLELIERHWSNTRDEEQGELVSKAVDRVVGQCALTTQKSAVGCQLELKQAGYYVLRARAEDARKNPIESAYSLYVTGDGELSWRGSDANVLELALDKPSYRVGEVAHVLVKSPYKQAEALLSVERADVQSSERRTVHGSLPTFDVRVTEAMRPNAFVSVLLRPALGRGASRSPSGGFQLGYAELKVEPESRRLAVEVTPNHGELRPGAEVDVALRVRDAKGQPAHAEVTFYAVDEGVLLLTNYTAPDPLAALLGPRPLQVATLETRANLAKITPQVLDGLLGMGKGADGGGGGEGGPRADFRASAVFLPNLETDARGETHAQFKLPDSLTRYRLVAVAVSESDRFGVGQSSVVTSKKLMVRPALPRFLRAGDEFQASAIVTAKNFTPGNVKVELEAKGLTLTSAPAQQVELRRDGQAELRFAARADKVGPVSLNFRASAGAERDSVLESRAVQLPLALEATALSAQTKDRAAEGLAELNGVRSDVGSLSVSVASTALVGIEAALTDLDEYPYGCSEQLASRLLPAGPLAALSRAFGITESPAQLAAARRLLVELVTRQRDDGGFALWPESTTSSPWVSAYVLWVLHASALPGAPVPPALFEHGRQYLRQLLAANDEHHPDNTSLAFALETLSELGTPDLGYMNRLFEARAQLSSLGRALLLHAFARQHAEAQVAELTREFEARIRLAGAQASVIDSDAASGAEFDSSTRTHAAALWALAAARPQHPLLVPLARGLLAARSAGRYRSTQETAFALLALDSYRRAVEGQAPKFRARVMLGERTLLEKNFDGPKAVAAQRTLPLHDLLAQPARVLEFDVDGSGTLFYEARLRYARAELPTEPLDTGFFVEKRQWAARTEELAGKFLKAPAMSSASFAGGERVIVELTVVNPEPRDFVVLDDPLPAGFEAINTELATSSAVDRALEGCAGCGDDDEFGSLSHKELRDDRALFFADHLEPGVYRYRYLARATTLGRFVVPPTRVEAMYEPEFFGRTAASRIEVR